MWHNELINIWTHLLGALFVLSLIVYISLNYSEIWKDKALEEIKGFCYHYNNINREV